PRPAEGHAYLTAPAPRTPDGKPDLSGVWDNGRNTNIPQRGARGADLNTAPARNRGGAAPAAGIPNPTFFNAGAGFPNHLPFHPWALELMKKRQADNSKENPDAHCLPMGFMQFHTHSEPRKIVQTRDVILIIYEANSGLRQIFTDGRPLPGKDAEPWWYGYSHGQLGGTTPGAKTAWSL